MKAKFKTVVSAAVIAALAAGAVTAITVTADKVKQPENVVSPMVNAAEKTEGEVAVKADNEVLPEDKLTELEKSLTDDVQSRNEEIKQYLSEKYADSPYKDYVAIELVPLQPRDGDYTLYANDFGVSVLSGFGCLFDAESFDCVVGDTAEIKANYGFKDNYKSVHVVNTYSENGKLVNKGAFAEGTGKTLTASVDYSGAGELVESKYFFVMHESGKDSPVSEIAVVLLSE